MTTVVEELEALGIKGVQRVIEHVSKDGAIVRLKLRDAERLDLMGYVCCPSGPKHYIVTRRPPTP